MSLSPWRRLARAEARLAGPATRVAGVDEAGRGPLAGPVVAAAVILDPERKWKGIADSKTLTREAREELFARVLSEARAFAWAVAGPRTIDRQNIRRATLLAMARAVALLRVEPDLILVDGVDTVPGCACAQRAVIDGDAKCLSIAAASIVAKVVRDRIMVRLDRVWPLYGFAQHKGYSTPEHFAALDAHGPCPIHRVSFRPVGQTSLFPRTLPNPVCAPRPDGHAHADASAVTEPAVAQREPAQPGSPAAEPADEPVRPEPVPA